VTRPEDKGSNHWLRDLINQPKTAYPLSGGRTPPAPEPKGKPKVEPKPDPNARKPKYKNGTHASNAFETKFAVMFSKSYLRTPNYYALRALYISTRPLSIDQVLQEAPKRISQQQIAKALKELHKASQLWTEWIRVRRTKDGLYSVESR